MPKGIDLIYKLNGNIDEGINVFELSPILLSVGTLINESHRALYPRDREVAINIKPFGKGSFEINILMFSQDFIQGALDFLKSDTGQNMNITLAYLGYIAQFSGIDLNLLQLISWLKGKTIKSAEPLASGDIKYNATDNTAIVVPQKVDQLFQNCTIQNNIFPAMGKPLQIPSVTSVESYIKHNENSTRVIYDKGIAESIKEYSGKDFPLPILESIDEVTENRHTVWVHPIKANLEGGSKSWSFRIGQDETITAHITDKFFLEEIKASAIRLANADRLKVEIAQKQVVKDGIISTTNEIVKVEEYVKAPDQPQMKF